MSKQSFSDFYDMIPYIILKAPDRFPLDYKMDTETAFSELNEYMVNSREELGELYEEVESQVVKSLEYYRNGDIKNGIRCLQVVDNVIREKGK